MCHVEKSVHYLQCQGHSEGLYNRNMTILLYLLNCWSVCNQTWFDSIISWSVLWKNGITAVKGKVTEKSSKCWWMFVRTMSSEPQNILSPNLVWLCSIISQSVMQKNWFIVFSVEVTVRAYIIKIWLFLLYLLHYWLVCNQTWFDSTAS